jgi:hypothetical protein
VEVNIMNDSMRILVSGEGKSEIIKKLAQEKGLPVVDIKLSDEMPATGQPTIIILDTKAGEIRESKLYTYQEAMAMMAEGFAKIITENKEYLNGEQLPERDDIEHSESQETQLMNKLADTEIPFVGMGVTYGYGSDRYPGTIIEVSKSKKKIKFQSDEYKRVDNNGPHTENQKYDYFRNVFGGVQEASLRKDGKWKITGTRCTIGLGHRNHYYDPCF